MEIPIPSESEIIECRACGKKIFFARTPNMADMPLDAKPIKQGYIVMDLGPGETQHKCQPADMPIFTTHWGTCTDPARFRTEHKSYKK